MPRRAGPQRGYLKKSPVSWIGQWKEPTFDPETGKRKWKTQSAVISPLKKIEGGRERPVKRTEAQVIFHETILSKLAVRSSHPAALATVREFWERKMEPGLVRAEARRKTMEDWGTVMNVHILPVIGETQLRHVRPEQIERIIDAALREGHRRTAQKLHRRLGTLFRRAREIGWFSGELPTACVRAPKHSDPEQIALDTEQITMLLSGDPTPGLRGLPSPSREMVAFLAMTGLRIGELLGLRWKRVNLSDKPTLCDGEVLAPYSIAVREAFVRVYGKHLGVTPRAAYQDLKTHPSRRDVPLPMEAVELLREIRSCSKWTDPMHPVFAGQKSGKPVNASNLLSRNLKPALRRLGLPDVDWHGMRHVNGTLTDEVGMPTGQRKRILGHSNAETTARYTHAHLEAARPHVEAVAKALGGAWKKAGVVVPISEGRKAG